MNGSRLKAIVVVYVVYRTSAMLVVYYLYHVFSRIGVNSERT